MKPFPLDAPGEYHAKVLATYTDPGGHLWVSTMRHAGIVYPADIARGRAGQEAARSGGKYVERGSTGREGYVEANGTQHLEHLTFPYQSGDVLLVASENQGANKIEPVLTYQMQGDTSAWDTKLNGVGTTNLRIKTSNGYSPHLYPGVHHRHRVLLRRRAEAWLHGAVRRRREHVARAVLADQSQQLRRADRRDAPTATPRATSTG